MKLSNLLQNSKINWTSFLVEEDGRSYGDRDTFNISSRDFLAFAKKDYYFLNEQGLINALSNAKRAIDCQLDWILYYLGYDYLKFDEKTYPNIRAVIDEFESENEKLNDTTFKLKFIQAMEIAPSFLVSKIRLLRNKLEHEYVIPKKKEVREALDIAELFINATENVVYSNICQSFRISNNIDSETGILIKEIYCVDFHVSNSKNIEVRLCMKEEQLVENITSKDEEYVFLLKAMVSHNFCYLTKAFGKSIDIRNIKYKAILMDEDIMFP